MTASKLKGNLLEFFIRKILLNCGFTNVVSDGLFIYEKNGLRFVNGKGSAHDADVLMNPPIQLPFSYPYRLLFECKAKKDRVRLTIVRNALGLRQDINNFEIVTKAQIRCRQNNRRRYLAIENRNRYLYQVGVASLNGFSKPAIEFATNNKIPLLSLEWILPNNIISLFDDISNSFVESVDVDTMKEVTSFLNGNISLDGQIYLSNSETALSQIYNAFVNFENKILIGLLETGDLIFISTEDEENIHFLREHYQPLKARLHYADEEKTYWELSIQNSNNHRNIEFKFYLPKRIIDLWESHNFDYRQGLSLKDSFFGKIFIFINDPNMPFRIINLDRVWLNSLESE